MASETNYLSAIGAINLVVLTVGGCPIGVDLVAMASLVDCWMLVVHAVAFPFWTIVERQGEIPQYKFYVAPYVGFSCGS